LDGDEAFAFIAHKAGKIRTAAEPGVKAARAMLSRKLGNSGKIISLAMSLSRLASPSTFTFRGRVEREEAAGAEAIGLVIGTSLLESDVES